MSTEIIFIIATVCNLALALVLLQSNHRRQTNRLLAVLSASLAALLITNYTSETFTNNPLFWNRLVFLPPMIIPVALFLFIRALAGKENSYNKLATFYCVAGVGLSILLFTTSLFVADVTPRLDIHGAIVGYNIVRGPIYLVFVLYLISLLGISIWLLIRTYRSSKGLLKTQLRYVIAGTVLPVLWAFAFSILLVNITGSSEYARYGALSGTVLVVFYSLAIIRHQFLDVRYVAFRLLVYGLSIFIIIFVISVGLTFSLTDVLFGVGKVDPGIQVYYTAAAVLAALSFGPMKDIVDRLTNKLFFQKGYSTQEALDKISSFSTKSVDPNRIEKHALEVFNDTIRPTYGVFILFDNNNELVVGSNSGEYPSNVLEKPDCLVALSKIHQKITLPEETTQMFGHTSKYFELGRIGVALRLSTSNKSIGYLLLGERRSGGAYSNRDLKFLTIAANDLALALQNAERYEEIQAFNVTLQSKINEATKALKRTNSKLVALDDAKDEFISMASHQLRTPLTSVKGYISMMLEGDLGKVNQTQKQALQEAFDSSQRMVFLISDFLNVSRIRTGKFIIEQSPTDLAQIVKEEIAGLREMAKLRNQKLIYKPVKDFPLVTLDENKIRQVMMNMIDNAIFYTQKGGSIHITLEKTGGEILFKVKDNGIGVPLHDHHRLFTKFFRASNARQARPDGTGLGLFMAQKIVREQDGRIIFESTEGSGSTFGFKFPLGKPVSNR